MSEIDVKKCPYYEDGICYNEGVLYKYCEQCSDCMPKQLQQLKAENEELKEKLKIQKNKQLYFECSKMSFKNILYKFASLKQCLDEIEKICKESYTSSQKYYYNTSNIILNKIKEVKGE